LQSLRIASCFLQRSKPEIDYPATRSLAHVDRDVLACQGGSNHIRVGGVSGFEQVQGFRLLDKQSPTDGDGSLEAPALVVRGEDDRHPRTDRALGEVGSDAFDVEAVDGDGLGGSAGSITQLTSETCTLASPGHFWLDTASVNDATGVDDVLQGG